MVATGGYILIYARIFHYLSVISSLLHVELFVTGAFVAKHIVVALFWEQVVSQPPQIRPLSPCIYTGCAFIFLRFD
jgi:hypothetical protein